MKKQIDWKVGDLISIDYFYYVNKDISPSPPQYYGIVIDILKDKDCNIKIQWFNKNQCGYYKGDYVGWKKLNA